ncbi:SpoIVB peptidase [Clostridium sp. AF19-22AC]|jgi:stage IV sporulation protein B|uniref:Stage IV sporulation protein B n=1 Tax=Faecalicatena orotica TaxID=1544 RepID=A0A2Y9BDS4_9FIRM|nr:MULTISPECIES: SpoIVB peptidase [Clostridia]PWJ31885.1 stage IV sporulation protein B [Faecalicatena orotica]RHR32412.1 SpoIVB peptidase [Clostridium sp. AF19-22AC]SSA53711.1 stage IV sporulation protein B [Faecalicatena orotica]
MDKRWQNRLLVLFSAVFLSSAAGYFGWMAADAVEQTEVSTEAISEDTVLVGGMPVGIYMETDGVMVLDTDHIKGIDGVDYEPAGHLVKCGDYITGFNGKKIDNKKELMESLKELDEDEVVLQLRRDDETIDVKVKPVECEPDEYKLGIWVRDNVQGLGTVTFLTGNSEFGALGHGIHDTDTNVLLSIADGTLYKTSIHSIKKGENGIPGSMEGIIVYNGYNKLGTIEKNTDEGIYGKVDKIDELFTDQIPVQTAAKEEVEVGDATIRCFVDNEVKEYNIKVTDIDYSGREANKGLVIQVTDPGLLEKTGGIIQGMSGSPILQNGKLIGAVTHVFVQDSTKGYGIFIENMLENVASHSLSN